MNMLFLFQCGPVLEEAVGPWKFLGLYLTTGTIGFALSAWMDPFGTSVGASGALMGMCGLIGSLQHRYHVWSGPGVRSLLIYSVAWIIFGFLMPLNFDNWAHLGGLVSGLAIGYVLKNPAAR